MKHRDIVLGQFETELAVALIEFAKSLTSIEADFVIFMARKSLCLYDAMVRLGLPPIELPILSDRILDQDLSPLSGRSVALIDDTLICGTSIARAKRTLQLAGARVTTHVFAVNADWHCKALITPDSHEVSLNDRQMMSFCAAEVRALSLVPRPYIVDFPISQHVPIDIKDAHCFLSSVDWRSVNLSTELQARHGVSAYTFFPSDDLLAEVTGVSGDRLRELVSIAKVRAFARQQDSVIWTQYVPIVTFHSMSVSRIQSLSNDLLDAAERSSGRDLTRLRASLIGPESHCRMLQFLVSAGLGTYFARSARAAVGITMPWEYVVEDGGRLFGTWFQEDIGQCIHRMDRALLDTQYQNPSHSVDRGTIDAESAARQRLTTYGPNTTMPEAHSSVDDGVVNLFSTFAELFVERFHKDELPARQEVLRMGLDILDATREQAPHRDRLETGIPWSVIAKTLASKHNLLLAKNELSLLSLLVDMGNDLGICVPITVVSENIVYRAYRHGEDVLFTDNELGLAHESARGFLTASGRRAIPKLHLEKLLVLLIRIGAAKKFLEPLYGPSGSQGTARIAFDLKGAVAVLSRGPKDRADRDIWLSKYLVHRQVLAHSTNGQYTLGKRPDGNYLTPDAPQRAYEVGWIIGQLCRESGKATPASPALNGNHLTLLATCLHPRDAAAAIQVELSIFRSWFENIALPMYRTMNWQDAQTIKNSYQVTLKGKGYEALHNASMKAVGYRGRTNAKTIAECGAYLDATVGNEIISGIWTGYFAALGAFESVGEREVFDQWLERALRLLWECGILILMCKVCLQLEADSRLSTRKRRNRYASLGEVIKFSNRLSSTGIAVPDTVEKWVQRLRVYFKDPSQDFDTHRVFDVAVARIQRLMPQVSQTVEAIEAQLSDFGRIAGRRKYDLMVYYDIIDSSPKDSAPDGTPIQEYRKRVRALKHTLNTGLRRITYDARKFESEVYCWNGDITSTNDCKHIFLHGKYAKRYCDNIMGFILSSAMASDGVRIRVYCAPCDFAGSSAYRYFNETEVVGERFWEYLSRVSKKARDLEDAVRTADDCFLMIIGGDRTKDRRPAGIGWKSEQATAIKPEIEALSVSVDVRYGTVTRL